MISTDCSKKLIAGLVEQRLKDLGMSRYALARLLGVNDARIKQICEGQHEPRFSFVVNMAEALKVPVSYFSDALENSEIPA